MSLRVCYILPRLIPGESGIIVGGYASNCVPLALELVQLGVEMDILTTTPGKSTAFLADHPVREIVKPLPVMGRGLMEKGIRSIWALRRMLKQRMAKKNYDIVHCHSGTYPYAIIPLAVNTVTSVRLHSLYCPIGARGGVHSGWWETPSAIRFLFNRLDRVIAVTSNVRQSLKRVGIASDKISFIPMSVDTSRFRPLARYNESHYFPKESKGARFLFVGNASKGKGLVELLGALRILVRKGFSPYLVATIENQSEIKEYESGYDNIKSLIINFGLENNVQILGLIEHIEKLYAETDIVVIPWRTTRGPSDYPMILLESMAMSKCVVSTPVGGCPELMEFGKAGILTEGYSTEAIAAAMQFAIEHAGVRSRIARNAQMVSERFSTKLIGKQMVSLYERTLIKKEDFAH